jgi:signal transduction histidine kinase
MTPGAASAPARGAGRLALQLLGTTLLYLAAAHGGLLYAVVGSTVTLVWAPSGIALAALLVFGPRMALGVLLGALLANAWTGLPLWAAASIALGNALEAWVGATLLTRVARFRKDLGSLRDVLALIALAALLSTTVSALVGVSTLALLGTVAMADYDTVWLMWWLGDMMGVLVVTPLLLLPLGRPLRAPTRAEALEILALCAALALVGWRIFGAAPPAAQGHYVSSLAVFPFVIWGALRFEQWGAGLVTLLVSVLAIWGTAQGSGPFAQGLPVDSLMRWCAFGIVTAVTGLLLAAAMAQQRRAQQALQRSHAELEQRVLERTEALSSASAELQREMAANRRLEGELIRLSEEQQQALGRELHDGLGQLLTSLSLMCAAVQQRLDERGAPEAEALQRIALLIEQATAMTRSVARGLYPVALEFGGLPAALAQLAEHTRDHLQRDCVFLRDPELRPTDPLRALNLYRIAQEAVNNAVKHSQARHLRIELSQRDGQHHLSISDDGIGMDIARQQTGLGLASMRFRAALLGGHWQLLSRAGQGTTVSVSTPQPPDD